MDNSFKTPQEDYQRLFEKSDMAMIILDKDGMYLEHNKAYRLLMGYIDKEDLSQFQPEDVSPERQPNGVLSKEQISINNAKAFQQGRYEFPWLHQRTDGVEFLSYVVIERIFFMKQECLLVKIHDIDEQEKIRRIVEERTNEIENENLEMKSIFQNTLVGLFYVDEHRIIKKCNQKMYEIMEVSYKEQLMNQTTRVIYDSDEAYLKFGQRYKEALKTNITFETEYQFRTQKGHIIWCKVSGSQIFGDIDQKAFIGTIWVVEDITDRKKMEVELENQYLIAKDSNPLTGLPGNNSIKKHMQMAIDEDSKCCIVYIDLDEFKAYNDKYGFVKGDEVIKFTADLLSEQLEILSDENYFLGHIGGDDFVIIFHNQYIKDVVREVIGNFDQGIRRFYSKDDLEAGEIVSVNRQGNTKTFPIMGVSLAGVILEDVRELNYIEIIDMCVELKKKAKQTQGSSYALNRRIL